MLIDPQWQVVAGWTTSTVVALLLVLGMWSYNVVPPKAQYDIMTQLTYAGLSRPAWGAVLAWIIYACHYGYGGACGTCWGPRASHFQ